MTDTSTSLHTSSAHLGVVSHSSMSVASSTSPTMGSLSVYNGCPSKGRISYFRHTVNTSEYHMGERFQMFKLDVK